MTNLSAEDAGLGAEPCTSAAAVDRLALYALLCLLQIPFVEGTAQEEVSRLQVDGSIEFTLLQAWPGCVCLLCVSEVVGLS